MAGSEQMLIKKRHIKSAEYLKCERKLQNGLYPIPRDFYSACKNDLKFSSNPDIRKILKMGIVEINYQDFFTHLLWLEEFVVRHGNTTTLEISTARDIRRSITLKTKTFCLRVPGLTIKYPSIKKGDLVSVYLNNDKSTIYYGEVISIEKNELTVGNLHKEFFANYSKKEVKRLRIVFLLNRTSFVRQHEAIKEMLVLRQWIFPAEDSSRLTPHSVSIGCRLVSRVLRRLTGISGCIFFNESVGSNPEQRAAVESIVSGTSGSAPFLLYGPPGTGKTTTLVEAILQLVKHGSNVRILVCADSNTAADNMACALIRFCEHFDQERFLMRYISRSRDMSSIPRELKPYCYTGPEILTKEIALSLTQTLGSYKILVTTLSHAAKLQRFIKTLGGSSNYVFVDEAAQASEPSTLIPLTLLGRGGGVVLAGDPRQLGPVVMSRVAAKAGLDISLMERLRDTCPLYSRSDSRFSVMLKKNFRSHGDILEIPNQLFYDKQLTIHAAVDHLSMVSILGSAKSKSGRAIEFCGLPSQEKKQDGSPSHFNPMEAKKVAEIVKILVSRHRVAPEDIGIVTPYVLQVNEIQRLLKNPSYHTIEIGSVEAFQGREKRVIIISTVRSNKLGFVVDEKRFNVALTRAKAKAIVVGNPQALERDAKWNLYQKKCKEYGSSYIVTTDEPRKKHKKHNLVNKIKNLKID